MMSPKGVTRFRLGIGYTNVVRLNSHVLSGTNKLAGYINLAASREIMEFYQNRSSFDTRFFINTNDYRQTLVWQLRPLQLIGKSSHCLPDGGDRTAYNPLLRLLICGSWDAGISCVQVDTHELLWDRTDLLGIQNVQMSAASPDLLYVELEAPDYIPGSFGGVVVLDVRSGTELARYEKWHSFYTHPYLARHVAVADDNIILIDDEMAVVNQIGMNYFAILDVAFREQHIAVAEGRTGLRVFDDGGTELLHYREPGKQNISHCRFDLEQPRVHCLNKISADRGRLITVDYVNGEKCAEHLLDDCTEFCFLDDSPHYVNRTGQIFRAADGQVVQRLAF
ncbi:MAG: hypothetical protein H6651_10090 [Ardenticatenales bacterium]|nr:hypothetical protein [Ardenticatenales bacterium]